MIPFDIPRRARFCATCQASFLSEMPYVSRLDKKQRREDFCPICWEHQKVKGIAHWRGEVPAKTATEKKTDKLERAFESLREAKSPKEAYILALFLQRKKWLTLRGELDDRWIYEVIETEEMIEVPKVQLKLEDAALQESIREKLCI